MEKNLSQFNKKEIHSVRARSDMKSTVVSKTPTRAIIASLVLSPSQSFKLFGTETLSKFFSFTSMFSNFLNEGDIDTKIVVLSTWKLIIGSRALVIHLSNIHSTNSSSPVFWCKDFKPVYKQNHSQMLIYNTVYMKTLQSQNYSSKIAIFLQ